VAANIFSEAWLVWELFHTASGTAFADIPIDNHRETWPSAASDFEAGYGNPTTKRLAPLPRPPKSAPRSIFWKRARSSMGRSAPSMSARPSTPNAFFSISPMKTGGLWKLGPMDGG
jgi:hypothetical protein